jgi:DNA-binding transcriptional ArsR family regulator
MSDKHEYDYIAKHEQIIRELTEIAKESDSGCFSVAKIATRVGMDHRTVRIHLKIMELDNVGVFVDPELKEFCTREGIITLARRLGLKEIADE